MLSCTIPFSALALLFTNVGAVKNTSYTNPVIPGWHSDPSCVFVKELDNTLFCTTSSFMAFPGNPIYATQDFVNWRLASNALSRVEQLPEIRTATNIQIGGMFANTLRYHKGKFWLISAWANIDRPAPVFVLNTATNPYDDASWTNMVISETPDQSNGFTIDPDLFWEDDGSLIVAASGQPAIQAFKFDVNTGKLSKPFNLWTGTGGSSVEGPHIYKKDGYYYLLVAEGGTQIGHAATIARAKTLNGTWESSPTNPLVSNARTNQYFQTVGHADLFQDANDNWWGVALATRGGPALYNQSILDMGRETSLYPVSWPKGQFPVADQVRGRMSGPLPQARPQPRRPGPPDTGLVPGKAEFVDFKPGSSIPKSWLWWRAPFNPSDFQVSPEGHPNTLQIASSRANMTGDATFNATREGLNGIFRRQEHTYFNFTVDLDPSFGSTAGDEFGVSNFLNQDQHVDLGILYTNVSDSDCTPTFRFRARSARAPEPKDVFVPVPKEWLRGTISVRISSTSESKYSFFVASSHKPHEEKLIAEYTTALLTNDGAGNGALMGVYATTNGGSRKFNGYTSQWRYEPVAQKVDYDDIIPYKN